MSEPKHLKRGKQFHRKIQRDWLKTAQGVVAIEQGVKKESGARGRVDVFVSSESDDRAIAIVEIKDSNWDRMTQVALRRNITRQTRQIWSYVHSQLGVEMDVCPGVIFRRRPKQLDRLKMIEETFNENGIQVVWDDEGIVERRGRSQQF